MLNYHKNHSNDVPIRGGSITSGPERGAYPITDRSSLEDAIHAYGRAKDKEVMKAAHRSECEGARSHRMIHERAA